MDKFWMTWKMTSLSAITVIRYLWVNHFFKIIESGILMKMVICLADFVINTFQTIQNYASTIMQSISQWIAKIVTRLLSILPHCRGSHLPHALSTVLEWQNSYQIKHLKMHPLHCVPVGRKRAKNLSELLVWIFLFR